ANWAFFGAFPEATTFGAVALLPVRMRRLAAGVGAVLLGANVALLAAPPQRDPWRGVVTLLWHDRTGGAFWPVVLALTAAALGYRALDVKLYVRRALQYALARGTVLLLAAAPFATLAFLVYQARDRRVAELLAGGRGALLLGAGAGGLLIARGRRRVLDALDRRFFREEYDARVILRDLAEGIRRVADLGELERLVTRE